MRIIGFTICLFVSYFGLFSQHADSCSPTISPSALSQRIANYTFEITLDHITHSLEGREWIEWKNLSSDTIRNIRLYMYLNAFKNNQSSYLKGSMMNVMGQDLSHRKDEDWGWVSVVEAFQNEKEITDMYYVQPTDGNPLDQSVLEIVLDQPILPGATLSLDMVIEAKLPRIISRSGFAEHGHHHFVHWYPKMGVYEQDKNGEWGWNCHQFLRQMEFYGDHGNYDVTIEHDASLTLGGSGCFEWYKEPVEGAKGRVSTRFNADDVIDFGWVASPNLLVHTEQWRHVEIRLLYPKIHKRLVPRLIDAALHGLEYMDKHVGEYPYSTLTILDPPVHGLRSGFMEYPTYITGGSFYAFPKGLRSLESLIIHEFAHQYFMQMVANNEKEDPWLDEGFVTFYEDCIMEDAYGDASLFDLLGYRVRNSSFTRNEYASLPNHSIGPIAVRSWDVRRDYKGIIYSKTATVLQTLKRYIGEEHFDEMMRNYFEQNKFAHPRKDDFVSAVLEEFERHPNILTPVIEEFLTDVLDGTKVCDYAVTNIFNGRTPPVSGLIDRTIEYKMSGLTSPGANYSSVRLERWGSLIVPVDVRINWSDGTVSEEMWDGKSTVFVMEFSRDARIVSAEIDPERKLFLDIDFNNNSISLQSDKGGIWKYAMRSIYWVQNAIQSTSFLM